MQPGAASVGRAESVARSGPLRVQRPISQSILNQIGWEIYHSQDLKSRNMFLLLFKNRLRLKVYKLDLIADWLQVRGQ